MKLRFKHIALFCAALLVLLSAIQSPAANIARFEGDDIVLENNLVRISFAAEYGQISSWIIKSTGQELVGGGDYKGLMCFRLYPGTWVGEWPTEIGRARYSNSIQANTDNYAVICQYLVLSEDHFAKGLKVKKYYTLRKNSYNLGTKIVLTNTLDSEISYNGNPFLLTIESNVNTGSGGRVAYKTDGGLIVQTSGGAVYDNISLMAIENESQDAVFGSYFAYPTPQSAWVLESNGHGKDMEPHFGPYIFAPKQQTKIKMALYGGPGSINDIQYLLSLRKESFPEGDLEAQQTNLAPTSFTLFQNYPNPFNPTTYIQFESPEFAKVRITIYNTTGQEIKELTNLYYQAGTYSLEWDGKDRNGNEVPSGVYLYQVQTNSFRDMKKMTLVR